MESGYHVFSSKNRRTSQRVARGRRGAVRQEVKIGQGLCALLWMMIHLPFLSCLVFFDQSFGVLLFASIITLLFFFVLSDKRYKKQIRLLEIVALIVMVLIFIWQKETIEDFKELILRSWFMDEWENVAFEPINRRYVTLLFLLLIGGLGWWGHEKTIRHVVFSLEGVIFSICMSLCQIEITKGTIVCVLCYFLLVVTKLIYFMKHHEEGREICRGIVIYLFPIYLTLSIGITLLPVKVEPLSSKTISYMQDGMDQAWQQVKKVAGENFLEERFNKMAELANAYYETTQADGDYEEFETLFDDYREKYGIQFPDWQSEIGETNVYFSQRKNIGEPLCFQDKKIFNMEVMNVHDRTIYLAGDEKASYKNSYWYYAPVLSDDEMTDHEYDVLSCLYGLGLMKGKDEVKLGHINIEYGEITTRMLLYPRTTYKLEESEEVIPVDETGRRMQLSRSKKLNEKLSYELAYYDFNEKSKEIADYLRGLDQFNYTDHVYDIQKYATFCGWHLSEQVQNATDRELAEKLQQYGTKVKEVYTLLPSTLPERVKILASDITESYDNQYDKLCAIEAYLQSGKYTYSVAPEMLPHGEDFVDHFLFESLSGYCSHFASSMVLLARSVGIPARMVEGYAISMTGQDVYEVKDSAAHAWVEAYFQGFGWVKFEPTPTLANAVVSGNGEEQMTSSVEVSSTPSMVPEENIVEEEPTKQPVPFILEVKDEEEADGLPIGEKEADKVSIGEEDQVCDEINGYNKSYKQVNFTWVIICVVIVLCISGIVYRYKEQVKKWWKKRKTLNVQFELHINSVYRKLKKQGLSRRNNETITSYKQRLMEEMTVQQQPFIQIYEDYTAYRYGEVAITKEALARLLSYEKTRAYKKTRKLKKK